MINLTEVKKSDIDGFGVFATEDIRKDAIIEECPVIREYLDPEAKVLLSYKFVGRRTTKTKIEFYIVPTGNALLYNSSEDRNVKVHRTSVIGDIEYDYKNRILRLIATRDIKKGEELFLDYKTSEQKAQDKLDEAIEFWESKITA